MAQNTIEIQIGLPTEPQTFFSLSVLNDSAKLAEKNTVKLYFPCREKSFARSLQVLLAPYFSLWNPKIEIVEEDVVVVVNLTENFIMNEVSLEIRIGMRIDGLKENFLSEVFESLSMKLVCKDIQEILNVIGVSGVCLASADVSLNIDPEDVPPEFLAHYGKELQKYFKMLEVLDAVRPLLTTTQIRILGAVGGLTIKGELIY